ncbi:hypothetical protein [Chryseobacterium sp. GVT01B]|uniref:hypothetical protein n=1 Tax=Chryseobacterium sp. GVT01B TaxID=2862675 RepID=UPI001CC0102C|nr:hypothetical protein [Chryseobacterium sp. GVT01B]
MKNMIVLFSCLLISSFSFSQDKTDTIVYKYNKEEYNKAALSYVRKMIDANVKYGENKTGLITNMDHVEVIIHPVFQFKKEIIENDGNKNLLQLIDFKNTPETQLFDVYYKGKFVYSFKLPDEKNDKAEHGDRKSLTGYLSIDSKMPENGPLDYTYAFRNYFSFYIDKHYCALIDDKIVVVSSVAIPAHIEIQDFNSYFYPELNYLKAVAKNIKNPSYETFILKKAIPPAIVKVISQ